MRFLEKLLAALTLINRLFQTITPYMGKKGAMKLVKGLEHTAYEEQLRELEKKGPQGNLITFYNSLKGECSEMGDSLFSQATSNRRRGNGLKLQEERLRLDIRKNFYNEKIVKCWNRLPSKVLQSPFL